MDKSRCQHLPNEDRRWSAPLQIWNCNESGCQDVPKEDEVIRETRVPQYSTVPKEQCETSIILTFANVAGLVVPPVIIHKGGKVSDMW